MTTTLARNDDGTDNGTFLNHNKIMVFLGYKTLTVEKTGVCIYQVKNISLFLYFPINSKFVFFFV